jgi:hypothetical protein
MSHSPRVPPRGNQPAARGSIVTPGLLIGDEESRGPALVVAHFPNEITFLAPGVEAYVFTFG